ncbi:MAG: shikimate dehydrogenase [Nitrososphaerota archaeon]|nr:shikimate dehydrogenase [Candidatus Bathyarchaeota archaeon]MDW8193242.1 shikimate dehydrogenase [Nitrososphaerota archaeon]
MIAGTTKVFCVIGDPIEHSLSPAMHNAAFRHLGLDAVFVAFRVDRKNLEHAVKGIRSLGIAGVNVTMPHKTAIISYLDELNKEAEFVGAVNTVLNAEGKLVGFNTDGIGAVRALKESGLTLKGKKIVLIGAGGAGKAIAFQLAQEACELRILNRDGEKAKQLAAKLERKFNTKILGNSLSQATLKECIKDADVLINATSVGMQPNHNQTPVDRELLKPGLTVMDIVYNPVETRLIREAKSAGANVVYGTEMLIFQGAASFEIWWKTPAPVDVMRKALSDKLCRGGA